MKGWRIEGNISGLTFNTYKTKQKKHGCKCDRGDICTKKLLYILSGVDPWSNIIALGL